jgi:hypothetical protein
MMIGHECERGWSGGINEGEGAKQRILRGRNDESTLHIYKYI